MSDPQWRNGGPPARPLPARRPTPYFLTAREVAAALRVSKMTVHREIGRGNLKAVRAGKCYRIAEIELSAYVARHGRSLAPDFRYREAR